MASLSLLTMPLGMLSILFGLGEPKLLQPSGFNPTTLQVEWQSPWIVDLIHEPVAADSGGPDCDC